MRVLTSLLSMKMRFETPLSGSMPQALRSLRTAKRGKTSIFDVLRPRTSEHGLGCFQNPILRIRAIVTKT